LTFTGRYVKPFELTREDIHIEDIAHALSNICRFTGHTSSFYSVAQHCVIMSQQPDIYRAKAGLHALLHDAAEAYLGDLCTPLKKLPEMAVFCEAELRARVAIAEHFNLSLPEPTIVEEHDLIALATERRDLMPSNGVWLIVKDIEPYPQRIIPWVPAKAERMFLNRFMELA
jgi:hypothetical protein